MNILHIPHTKATPISERCFFIFLPHARFLLRSTRPHTRVTPKCRRLYRGPRRAPLPISGVVWSLRAMCRSRTRTRGASTAMLHRLLDLRSVREDQKVGCHHLLGLPLFLYFPVFLRCCRTSSWFLLRPLAVRSNRMS